MHVAYKLKKFDKRTVSFSIFSGSVVIPAQVSDWYRTPVLEVIYWRVG